MITPNPEVAELTRRARESWQSLRRGESWEHWLTIGRAIDAFRRQLFHDLKINEPKGQAYKEAMGAYLAENGWQQPTKEDPNGIDNTARVNLQKIVDRLPEVERWRGTLPLGNQLKQNHPNTVWRAFSKAFAEPGDNGTKRKVETARLREERNTAREERDQATAEVARLTAENEALETRAETADAHAGYMWEKTPDEVAEKMVNHDRDKAIFLHKYLGEKLFPPDEKERETDERITRIAETMRRLKEKAELADLVTAEEDERTPTVQKALNTALHPNTGPGERQAAIDAAIRVANGDTVFVSVGSPPVIRTEDDNLRREFEEAKKPINALKVVIESDRALLAREFIDAAIDEPSEVIEENIETLRKVANAIEYRWEPIRKSRETPSAAPPKGETVSPAPEIITAGTGEAPPPAGEVWCFRGFNDWERVFVSEAAAQADLDDMGGYDGTPIFREPASNWDFGICVPGSNGQYMAPTNEQGVFIEKDREKWYPKRIAGEPLPFTRYNERTDTVSIKPAKPNRTRYIRNASKLARDNEAPGDSRETPSAAPPKGETPSAAPPKNAPCMCRVCGKIFENRKKLLRNTPKLGRGIYRPNLPLGTLLIPAHKRANWHVCRGSFQPPFGVDVPQEAAAVEAPPKGETVSPAPGESRETPSAAPEIITAGTDEPRLGDLRISGSYLMPVDPEDPEGEQESCFTLDLEDPNIEGFHIERFERREEDGEVMEDWFTVVGEEYEFIQDRDEAEEAAQKLREGA
jgi:hypothetical protein